MKRFLALLIACIMLLTCLAACDTADTDSGNNDASADADADESKNEGGDTEDENTEDDNKDDGGNAELTPKEYFSGKVCVTFGASNTWYDGNAYNWGKEQGVVATGYQSYMREELGMTVHNLGVSGIVMPSTIKDVLMKPAYADLWTGVDYVTIKGGINEERRNIPMGTLMPKGSNFDTTTFIGSIQAGIEYLLEKNPDITIILMTTTNAWIYADGQGQEGYAYDYDKASQPTTDGRIPEKWANAMKEIAELYDLPVCDLYNKVPLNTVADREKYLNDPEPPENQLYSTHPNTEGYKIVADVIIDTFIDLMKEGK